MRERKTRTDGRCVRTSKRQGRRRGYREGRETSNLDDNTRVSNENPRQPDYIHKNSGMEQVVKYFDRAKKRRGKGQGNSSLSVFKREEERGEAEKQEGSFSSDETRKRGGIPSKRPKCAVIGFILASVPLCGRPSAARCRIQGQKSCARKNASATRCRGGEAGGGGW